MRVCASKHFFCVRQCNVRFAYLCSLTLIGLDFGCVFDFFVIEEPIITINENSCFIFEPVIQFLSGQLFYIVNFLCAANRIVALTDTFFCALCPGGFEPKIHKSICKSNWTKLKHPYSKIRYMRMHCCFAQTENGQYPNSQRKNAKHLVPKSKQFMTIDLIHLCGRWKYRRKNPFSKAKRTIEIKRNIRFYSKHFLECSA